MKTFTFSAYDKEILLNSSSGGAFSILAKYILNKKGVVYGAQINKYSGVVEHIGITNEEYLNDLRGAKYSYSLIKNTFNEIKENLKKRRLVLFVGAPCQVNMLHEYLINVDTSRLLLVDFICHGCPKPYYWQKFLKEYNFKPPYTINFRNKDCGWKKYNFKVNDYFINHSNSDYFYFFLKNYTLMDNCYSCKSKGKNRLSDITLGDAWGIEEFDSKYNPNGVGIIIQNSDKIDVSQIFVEYGELKQIPDAILKLFNPSYFVSSKRPNDYYDVLDSLRKNGFLNTYKIITKQSVLTRCKRKVKRCLSIFIKKYCIRKLLFKNKINHDTKIGIISDYYYNNFGNKLQSFALQMILEQKGFKTQIITWEDERTDCALSFLKFKLDKKIKRLKAIFKCSLKYENNPFIFNANDNSEHSINRLNVLLFGSDQIWNYKCHDKIYLDLGMFHGKGVQPVKLSYAASIGTLNLDSGLQSLYSFALSKFNTISVREVDSIKTLEDIGVTNTRYDLDPTLLINKEDWVSYVSKYSKIKPPKNEYILVYALSCDELKNKSEKIANTKNIDIVNCMEYSSKYFCINQFDFVNLIMHSNYVITDSYHALIFSIIFGKKVMLFNRKSNPDMNMRMYSLFKELNIKEDVFNNGFIDTRKIIDSEKFISKKSDSLKYIDYICDFCSSNDTKDV